MYGIEADEFDEELESVVVYCLTSSCYENERNYDDIKHIVPYLQDILMKENMLDNDNISDSIMGLDSIIMTGGTAAIKDFMKYHNIMDLIRKFIEFYLDNIRQLLIIQGRDETEDFAHITYPSI